MLSPGRRMNSQRRLPGPPETTVVGRTGSQTCPLMGSQRRGSCGITSTISQSKKKPRSVLEAKRLTPLVPLAFGRARRTFTNDGYEIPEGWTVYLALHLCNRDPAVFEEPERFDPDRFERGEHRSHPLAFIPQGAEPPTGHRCLGLDYSTFLVLAFLAVLVREYEWDLPPQDLAYDWRKRPPEPRDGIRVVLRAKR